MVIDKITINLILNIKVKNKIKIAVVGIGLMGSQHLKALSVSKKAKLHSIVDVNKNSIIHAKKFKVPFYRSSTELLDNNKPDAVIVATPNQFHEKHTISFLNAKIPVLLENQFPIIFQKQKKLFKAQKKNSSTYWLS